MYKNKITLILALFMLILSFTGCFGPKPEDAGGDTPGEEIALVNDPDTAAEEIYAALEESEAQLLSASEMRDILGLEAAYLEEYYCYYSDYKYGLADVFIIKPAQGRGEDIKTLLYEYKDKRVREFESFDILNSANISQNAVVYERGEYIIFLMTPDNDLASDIIYTYIKAVG